MVVDAMAGQSDCLDESRPCRNCEAGRRGVGEGVTYRVPGRGPEEHRVRGVDLVAADALACHLALHELLVRPEVDAVSDRLAPKRDHLALVDPRDAMLAVDLLHRVKRPGIHRARRGLCL